MIDFEITSGEHKGEVAVVVEKLENGINKVLTLGGICYCDESGKEVCPVCLGTGIYRSIFGRMRCQRCLGK